jgi:hypothetical protein
LLVPGWAGIASTKWLTGVEAIDRAFDGFWNTDNYVIWDERGDPLRPVAEMPPKSVIVIPANDLKIPPGPIAVAGWAWSGFGSIQTVEVSTDAGCSWQAANLHLGKRRGWRRWDLIWNALPGRHHLRVRATDERRLRQPVVAAWNAKGYLMNAIQEILVEVQVES